jgi:hypothetical protein
MTTLRLSAFPLLFVALSCADGADEFRPVPLRAEIKGTLPMTGLVFWSTSEHRKHSESSTIRSIVPGNPATTARAATSSVATDGSARQRAASNGSIPRTSRA